MRCGVDDASRTQIPLVDMITPRRYSALNHLDAVLSRVASRRASRRVYVPDTYARRRAPRENAHPSESLLNRPTGRAPIPEVVVAADRNSQEGSAIGHVRPSVCSSVFVSNSNV